MELLNGAGLFIEGDVRGCWEAITATISGLRRLSGDLRNRQPRLSRVCSMLSPRATCRAFEVQVAAIEPAIGSRASKMLGIDWVEIWATIEDTFNQATANIQTGWVSWTSSLASFWNDLVSTIQDIWDQFTGWLESTFVWVKSWSERSATRSQRNNSG